MAKSRFCILESVSSNMVSKGLKFYSTKVIVFLAK